MGEEKIEKNNFTSFGLFFAGATPVNETQMGKRRRQKVTSALLLHRPFLHKGGCKRKRIEKKKEKLRLQNNVTAVLI